MQQPSKTPSSDTCTPSQAAAMHAPSQRIPKRLTTVAAASLVGSGAVGTATDAEASGRTVTSVVGVGFTSGVTETATGLVVLAGGEACTAALGALLVRLLDAAASSTDAMVPVMAALTVASLSHFSLQHSTAQATQQDVRPCIA